MKKTIIKIVAAVLIFVLLLPTAALAVEQTPIRYEKEVENGAAEVAVNGNTATIRLSPDQKYMVSYISLHDSNGTKVCVSGPAAESGDAALVYTAPIADDHSYYLDYGFRRAIVRTDTKEMSVKPGETKQFVAWLNYSDDSIATRSLTWDKDIVFTSSNPAVATVDEQGNVTGGTKGYAVITASAKSGNGVSKQCYVLVEDGTEEKIGNITVFARFSPKELDVGHSFIVFKSLKDGVVIDKAKGFFDVYQPTQAYYDAIESYDGMGYDPVSFYYVTNGEQTTDENEPLRKAYADKLVPQVDAVGQLVLKKGQIATFGCTTHESTIQSAIPNEITGDVVEMLSRNYVTAEDFKTNPIRSIIGLRKFVQELIYDFSIDYNPINGTELNGARAGGGVCLNEELRRQVYRFDATPNVTISIDITQIQFDAMLDYMCNNNYFNIVERNCTEVASRAWNLVTASRPELHMEPDFGGITKAISMPVAFQLKMLEKGVWFYWDDTVEVTVHHPIYKADKAEN